MEANPANVDGIGAPSRASVFDPVPEVGWQPLMRPTQFGGSFSQEFKPLATPATMPRPRIAPVSPGAMPDFEPTRLGGTFAGMEAARRTDLPRGGQASLIPGQTAPAGLEFSQTPSGGQVGLPSDQAQGIRERVARAEITRGLNPIEANQALMAAGYEPSPEASRQKARVEESKAQMSSAAIVKSLEDSGMNRNEIAKKIGWKPGMSAREAQTRLGKLSRQKRAAMSATGDLAKARERSSENSKYKELEDGTQVPSNTEARAEELFNRSDDFGPDPESETSLRDYMKPGERNQFDRTTESMSNGTKNPNAERKLKKMMDKAEARREQDFVRKQAKEKRDLINAAKRKAQSAEQKAWLKNANDELNQIAKILKDPDELGLSNEQEEKYQQRTLGILDAINNFNTTGQIAGAPTRESAAQTGEIPVYNSEEEARAAGHKSGDEIRITGLGKGILQ